MFVSVGLLEEGPSPLLLTCGAPRFSFVRLTSARAEMTKSDVRAAYELTDAQRANLIMPLEAVILVRAGHMADVSAPIRPGIS